MTGRPGAFSRGSQPLRQFLIWAVIATSIAIVVFLVAGTFFALTQLYILAAGGGMFLAVQLGSLWLNRQGNIQTAIYLMCVAIAAYALLTAIVMPEMLVVSILGPLMMIALAQPYLGRGMLRVMNIAAFVLAVLIVSFGIYLHLFTAVAIELIGPPTILITSMVVAIILLLL